MSAELCAQYNLQPREAGTPVSGYQGVSRWSEVKPLKEQQKRVFKSEFQDTHFSYAMGEDGVDQVVSTTAEIVAGMTVGLLSGLRGIGSVG